MSIDKGFYTFYKPEQKIHNLICKITKKFHIVTKLNT